MSGSAAASSRSGGAEGRPRPTPPRAAKGGLQDEVYRELRRRLMVGGFLPGQTVTLRGLAEELGVSPMPVREAVGQIIAEGGFAMRPNRTVEVPAMTRERLLELLRVRCALEGMATEEACRRMTGRERAQLAKLNDQARAALDEDDAARSLLLNQRFHFVLYEAARSTVLMPIIEALWLQAGPFMHLSLASPGVRWDGRHHLELLRALEERDPRGARRAIERDIGKTAQYLLGTRFLPPAAGRFGRGPGGANGGTPAEPVRRTRSSPDR